MKQQVGRFAILLDFFGGGVVQPVGEGIVMRTHRAVVLVHFVEQGFECHSGCDSVVGFRKLRRFQSFNATQANAMPSIYRVIGSGMGASARKARTLAVLNCDKTRNVARNVARNFGTAARSLKMQFRII